MDYYNSPYANKPHFCKKWAQAADQGALDLHAVKGPPQFQAIPCSLVGSCGMCWDLRDRWEYFGLGTCLKKCAGGHQSHQPWCGCEAEVKVPTIMCMRAVFAGIPGESAMVTEHSRYGYVCEAGIPQCGCNRTAHYDQGEENPPQECRESIVTARGSSAIDFHMSMCVWGSDIIAKDSWRCKGWLAVLYTTAHFGLIQVSPFGLMSQSGCDKYQPKFHQVLFYRWCHYDHICWAWGFFWAQMGLWLTMTLPLYLPLFKSPPSQLFPRKNTHLERGRIFFLGSSKCHLHCTIFLKLFPGSQCFKCPMPTEFFSTIIVKKQLNLRCSISSSEETSAPL